MLFFLNKDVERGINYFLAVLSSPTTTQLGIHDNMASSKMFNELESKFSDDIILHR